MAGLKLAEGINAGAYLVHDLFTNIPKKNTRDGYGLGLVDAGTQNKNVVVLCADLTESTRSLWFAEKFPDRYLQAGVAEQNMASLAAGIAAAGKVVFISSYAVFSPGRNNEQIRTTISYNNWGSKPGKEINVKIGGAHAGISVGPDGATHQALEDVGLMRLQPGMVVLVPCDDVEARKATVAAANKPGPVYIRFGRAAYESYTTPRTPFEIGKAEVFRFGSDVALIGNGPLLYKCLQAAQELKMKYNVSARVINCHTVKPLDQKTILTAARECGALVTAEEHQWQGGLAGAVAEFIVGEYPVPLRRVGVRDRFGESGDPQELFEAFGLGVNDIVREALLAIKMKRK